MSHVRGVFRDGILGPGQLVSWFYLVGFQRVDLLEGTVVIQNAGIQSISVIQESMKEQLVPQFQDNELREKEKKRTVLSLYT